MQTWRFNIGSGSSLAPGRHDGLEAEINHISLSLFPRLVKAQSSEPPRHGYRMPKILTMSGVSATTCGATAW